MTPRRELKFVDLFAGSGGLSLGLELAGFVPLAFSEISPEASATYLANRRRLRHHPFALGDISKVSPQELRRLRKQWPDGGKCEIDLVCGGPPCQGFSGIGHRRTHKVERFEIPSNHLYRRMISVIRVLRPRMFLFENVRGLLSGRWTADGERGEIWRDVLQAFKGLSNYHVRPTVVQAKSYGVPQNRPRVLIVGIRRDLGFVPGEAEDAVESGLVPRPQSDPPPHLWEALGDLVDPEYPLLGDEPYPATRTYPHPATTAYQQRMRRLPTGTRVLEKGDSLVEQEYSNHRPRIRQKFRALIAGYSLDETQKTKKFAQRVLPKEWKEGVGPSITATSLPDDFIHYEQPRSLTVREWARLQGFPDWYEFHGKRTTGGVRRAGRPSEGVWDRETPKYTQIGNAVPVLLAEALGNHFAAILARCKPSRRGLRQIPAPTSGERVSGGRLLGTSSPHSKGRVWTTHRKASGRTR